MCVCVCVFFASILHFQELCRVVKTLPLIKLFSFNRMIFTKPRENPKNKKPKLFRECLVWGSCLFFFGFPRVFLFFWSWPWKTLKNQGVFGFLDKLMVKELWKTKKMKFFLVFCMDCCYMSSKNLSKNQRRPEYFCFFALLQVRVPSKNQKRPWVFLVFSRSWPKKTKKSTKNKKNKHEPQTKHFLKSFGFLVFWFYRGFFGFPHGLSPKEKSNSWLVPLNLEKTKKPKTKTFQRMFGLRLMFGFFLVFLEFFGFLVMTLKKLKKIKVFLVFWVNWWLKNCEKQKKMKSFLVFCMDCCYMSSKNLSKNQKRPEFFWFFALLQVRVPSKNQKNLEFF